jgi:threonine synthase
MSTPILFYSTNHKAKPLTFSEALLRGLAPDKGLYMPEHIPVVSSKEIDHFTDKEYYEIAFEISRKYLAGQIPDEDLLEIVKDAYDYDIPLEPVYERKYILRLDQGPTASFKDFAARMMGRLMQYYLKKENKSLLILTATSGDTGSAVASAFYGLENINTVILFPQSEVTDRQRKQMTILGKNVHVLALDAKFDDCQALVKKAFIDPDLFSLNLSSANSINIGRLIPQTIYYFYSFVRLRLGNPEEKVIFSVPSGNFGDMMGGVLALKMGLPIEKFIIATNENDEFPKYVKTGVYEKTEPSRDCISSAMNVGHPSNLARLIDLYGGIMDETGRIIKQSDLYHLRNEIFAVSISDILTRNTIGDAYSQYHLLLEPHGAVGWAGLMEFLKIHPEDDVPNQLFISLETAHPAKFPKEIQNILGIDPPLPPSLQGLDSKPETYEKLENDYDSFKEYLLKTF